MRTTIRQILTGVGLALLFGAAWGDGPSTRQVTLNIDATSLARALIQFTEQTGLQLVFPAEGKVRELSARPLAGTYTPQAALEKLLANSGLDYEYIDSKTVAIRVRKSPDSASRVSAAGQMRLAAVAEDGQPQESSAPGSKEKADVVVEGQRERAPPFSTGNLDLTRTEDDVLPFMVLTARDIQSSGALDLREFLRMRLPQNLSDDSSTELSPGAVNSFYSSGPLQNQVDLRGWGATETVFLLNGRRMGAEFHPRQSDSDNASPNLRGIPLASIERIEILSSAGSAIYGANATGGVINIITRRDYQGGQLSFGYETPADVLRPRRSMNFSYGLPLPWDMNLRLSGGYSDSDPLREADRADLTVERFRALALQRDPARLISRVNNPSDPGSQLYTSSTFYGATPNIRASSNTINLFAGLAGVPGSNYTSVPAGHTGAGGAAAFQPGRYNLQVPDLESSGASQGTISENTALSLGLDKRFNERWRLSLDYRYSQNEGKTQANNSFNFSTSPLFYSFFALDPNIGGVAYPLVPAAAPGNPFGREVQVTLYDPDMNRPELRNRLRSVNWEASATLHGEVGQWRGFLDASYSRNAVRNEGNSFLEPLGGWIAALQSGAYNPFVDPAVAAFAAPGFYEDYVLARYSNTGSSESYTSTLKASGPVLQLPAGPIQLTAGATWSRMGRPQTSVGSTVVNNRTGEPVVPSFGAVRSPTPQLGSVFTFDAYAGYAEAGIPLISARQGVRLVSGLELFGSGRIDHTERREIKPDGKRVPYGNTSTLHAFGLRYLPVKDVALRISRSGGFKPPNMLQVTPANPPSPTTQPTSATDPIRQEPVSLTYAMRISGGNPDLTPESTESTNVGLILTPRWVPGLRLSLDYLESVRNDAIFSLSVQEAINLEPEIPGLVQRGAPDGNASGAGPITFVDHRYINLRQVSSRSVDINLQQSIENVRGGRLLFSLAATRNLNFKVQATNTGPAVELVRNRSAGTARQIAWNGNAQVSWEGQRWGLGWSMRYFDYLLLPSSTYYLLQGGDRAPRAYTHDLNISYRSPQADDPRGLQWLTSGTAVTFGIKNVFDREPRFWAADSTRGVAPYDFSVLTGRSAWLRVRRDF